MKIKKIIMLLLFAVAIMGIITPLNAAMDLMNTKTKVNNVEFKEKKVATNKICWDSNGGKIGSKNILSTNIKKGAKIGKLPTTPKRSGFTFKGWYTKKSGGIKISNNTKPTSNLTYYAQWTKGNIIVKSKVEGYWRWTIPYTFVSMGSFYSLSGYGYYSFYKDGTFKMIHMSSVEKGYKGKYSVSGDKISLTDISGYTYNSLTKKAYDHKKFNNKVIMEYKIGKDNAGEYLVIEDLNRVMEQSISYASISSETWKKPRTNSDFITYLGL